MDGGTKSSVSWVVILGVAAIFRSLPGYALRYSFSSSMEGRLNITRPREHAFKLDICH
jgi:hypothetical protein